ncbi:hypothetical protein KCU78_g17105, partial [Aureobasidium melanogenum]
MLRAGKRKVKSSEESSRKAKSPFVFRDEQPETVDPDAEEALYWNELWENEMEEREQTQDEHREHIPRSDNAASTQQFDDPSRIYRFKNRLPLSVWKPSAIDPRTTRVKHNPNTTSSLLSTKTQKQPDIDFDMPDVDLEEMSASSFEDREHALYERALHKQRLDAAISDQYELAISKPWLIAANIRSLMTKLSWDEAASEMYDGCPVAVSLAFNKDATSFADLAEVEKRDLDSRPDKDSIGDYMVIRDPINDPLDQSKDSQTLPACGYSGLSRDKAGMKTRTDNHGRPAYRQANAHKKLYQTVDDPENPRKVRAIAVYKTISATDSFLSLVESTYAIMGGFYTDSPNTLSLRLLPSYGCLKWKESYVPTNVQSCLGIGAFSIKSEANWVEREEVQKSRGRDKYFATRYGVERPLESIEHRNLLMYRKSIEDPNQKECANPCCHATKEGTASYQNADWQFADEFGARVCRSCHVFKEQYGYWPDESDIARRKGPRGPNPNYDNETCANKGCETPSAGLPARDLGGNVCGPCYNFSTYHKRWPQPGEVERSKQARTRWYYNKVCANPDCSREIQLDEKTRRPSKELGGNICRQCQHFHEQEGHYPDQAEIAAQALKAKGPKDEFANTHCANSVCGAKLEKGKNARYKARDLGGWVCPKCRSFFRNHTRWPGPADIARRFSEIRKRKRKAEEEDLEEEGEEEEE